MRDEKLDIMKGLGIMAVIFGHMTAIPYYPWRNILFSFHMPLFFIIGGLLYKPRPVKASIVKDINRLIKPYCFTCLLLLIWVGLWAFYKRDGEPFLSTVIASIYGSGSNRDNTILGNVPMIGAIWFLWAMFWCKSIYNIISLKVSGAVKYIVVIIISLTSIVLDCYVINLPFAFLPGCSALVFFMIGDITKRYRSDNSCSKWVYFFLAVCMLCWLYCMFYSRLYLVRSYFENGVIDVLGACGGTYAMYIISKGFVKLPQINHLLSWMGRNSLALLCFHLLELDTGITMKLFNFYNISNSFCIVGTRLIIVLFAGYICSLIPYTKKVYGCL